MGVHTQTEQWLNNCIDYLKKKKLAVFFIKKRKKENEIQNV